MKIVKRIPEEYVQSEIEQAISEITEEMIRKYRARIMDAGWDIGNRDAWKIHMHLREKARVTLQVEIKATWEEIDRLIGGPPKKEAE